MTAKAKKAPAKSKAEVKKNVGGRPSELTPDIYEKLLEGIRAGVPIKTAVVALGIAEQSYYNWMKRGSDEQYRISKGEKPRENEKVFLEFLGSVTRAKEEAKAAHVAVIAKAGKNGDWRASAWWLQRQFRDEFGDTPTPTVQTINNTLNISATMSELQTLIAEVKESRTKELNAPSD